MVVTEEVVVVEAVAVAVDEGVADECILVPLPEGGESLRIKLFALSATYTVPSELTPIPLGAEKRELLPTPSATPHSPPPAMVATFPLPVSTVRMVPE